MSVIERKAPERITLYRYLALWTPSPPGVGGNQPSEEAEYVRADLHAGAVARYEALRHAMQEVVDAGFNYAEEYRWSLQEVLDADDKRGQ